MDKCLCCGKELSNRHNKFCSHSCSAKYNNLKRETTTKGNRKLVKCIKCENEIYVSIHSPKDSWYCDKCKKEFICPYCEKQLRTENTLNTHIKYCKLNPTKEELPQKLKIIRQSYHIKRYYVDNMRYNKIDLDITREQFDKYQEKQKVCEICGRTIEEATRRQFKYMAKRFCLDHDHKTNRFRGLLCSCCNRQLGWYEKYDKEIINYLNKNLDIQNKNI